MKPLNLCPSTSILMVQGTTSDAGKSTLVAGLCRLYKRMGINVAPFKPQNMALNSAVTADGGEIGRAQALQAQACRLAAHTDMNPVLIKPSSDTGAQIIIQGQALHNMQAAAYHQYKPLAQQAVLQSIARLQRQYEAVVVEGAGSPAEINLRDNDIANMGFAEAVDCPVILVADIDRGGVFAHIVGTLNLLSASEQQRVIGFVINRFRGDIKLLEPGLDWLEQHTGKPVLATIPYLKQLYLDAEDAIDQQQQLEGSAPTIDVIVPVLPRISNHTDFDSLRMHPQVNLRFVAIESPPPACDLIILPGSKNVREDLAALKQYGWQHTLARHLRYGGKMIGICGGLQMLGQTLTDPYGVEGAPGEQAGFGWLALSTQLQKRKALQPVTGTLSLLDQTVTVRGYEIHHGESWPIGPGARPMLLNDGRSEGYINADNNVFASYCHGLFDCPDACQLLLQWAGLKVEQCVDVVDVREQQIDRLADALEQNLDFLKLQQALNDYSRARMLCG